MTKDQRIKQLESYLERYNAITDELYHLDGIEWIMEDDTHKDLVELRQDIEKDKIVAREAKKELIFVLSAAYIFWSLVLVSFVVCSWVLK